MSRDHPMVCEHGVVFDWGDFQPSKPTPPCGVCDEESHARIVFANIDEMVAWLDENPISDLRGEA